MDTSKRGLGILASAVVLGLLADRLLQSTRLGLNGFLWIAALLAVVLGLARWQQASLAGEGRWLLLAALLTGAAFLWRDSPTLMFLDVLALGIALALAGGLSRQGALRAAYLGELILAGLYTAVHTAAGLIGPLFQGVSWRDLSRSQWSGRVTAVLRGLLITIPLLLLFGGLFASADPAFARLVTDLFRWDLENIMPHLVTAGFFAWISAGFLRAVLTVREPRTLRRPEVLVLGPVETGIILGGLNLLFLAFVLVQFRYLFGGEALVQADIGLTYAAYARRGFFELVAAAALLLPTLLVGEWLQPDGASAQVRLFRILSGTLLALLAVVMASAFQRMWLYQQAYGLTELRLFTTAFMIWVIFLTAWFAFTVLRGRRDRFAFGALVSGFVALGALHVLNPDALIARVNVNRPQVAQELDISYIAGLSADAVPVLLEALPTLEPQAQAAVAENLMDRYQQQHLSGGDWRGWNWSRYRALRLLEEHVTTSRR